MKKFRRKENRGLTRQMGKAISLIINFRRKEYHGPKIIEEISTTYFHRLNLEGSSAMASKLQGEVRSVSKSNLGDRRKKHYGLARLLRKVTSLI
jgi:hypothetical protein